MEETKYTENKIYFNAREWSICSDTSSSKGERTFVTDFEGGLSEAYCIGDRTPNVTEIGTKQLILEKSTKYTFYFWVKIERSPKNEAVCQLQIVYNGDFENKRVYVLSNGNIRASKTVEGWQLFEIPFVTEDNEYTQLRFFAKNAQCSIIPGREASNYASLKDDKTVYGNTSQGQDTADESETSDEQNPFKNISDGFKDFFSQFDSTKTENKANENSANDPFAAFNEFARQVKRDVQREVNKSVRKDIYNDIKSMKDDIVNELKNTFMNDNNDNK
ncbi:MAG: hypothetical protein J6P89_09585 [Oscillospiraceae bacterium]|nr:hypothetical protein [Oscillospiraceae bacterium]